jgi:RNA polymerase sigma-70 factor (ECF subfamily)
MQPTENDPHAAGETTGMPAPDTWLAEHGDCLYRTALLRVRNPDIAADLVQDTLLAALRTTEKFGGRSSVRTWLLGILKHKISDHFRKLGRETNFTDLAFFQDEQHERFDSADFWNADGRGPCAWNTSGEEALTRSEFLTALQACLGKLPERVSAVFLMREMDDEPCPAICETLGVSASNLWVMLHRARMALRHCLESTYFTPSPSPKK